MDTNQPGSPTSKRGRQAHFVAVYDEDSSTWSIDSEVLASDHVIYNMARNDGNWEPFAPNEAFYSQGAEALAGMLNPAVYISPDGNWGDAGGLLLLSRADVALVGDLTELYEEHGDGLITAVRAILEGPVLELEEPTATNESSDEPPTRLVSMRYVYEVEATSVEDAEEQARAQFAGDFGSLSPRDFGCVVE